jgi:hypothetical protein
MKIRFSFLLTAIVCAVFTSSNLFAQDGFALGAKVLGNATKFSATNIGYGYGAGGYASMSLLGPLSVRGELLYVSTAGVMDDKTTTFEDSGVESATYENRNLRFHTIEVPIMAQVTLPFLSNLNLRVNAGWAFGYNLAVFHISDNTYNILDATGGARSVKYNGVAENVGSSFEQYNSTLIGGLSANFERIHVDIRYQHGLINLSRMDVETSAYYGDYTSRILSVSAGYRLK